MGTMYRPNPGSPDAIDAGCICPVEHNHLGVTCPLVYASEPDDEPVVPEFAVWWVTEGCPVHAGWWIESEGDVERRYIEEIDRREPRTATLRRHRLNTEMQRSPFEAGLRNVQRSL